MGVFNMKSFIQMGVWIGLTFSRRLDQQKPINGLLLSQQTVRPKVLYFSHTLRKFKRTYMWSTNVVHGSSIE